MTLQTRTEKLERQMAKLQAASETPQDSNADPELAIADPLVWGQRFTCTKDNHWREAGENSPYRPFPQMPYFRPLISMFQAEPVVFVEKSRDMMVSWLCVLFFTHTAMTTPGREVLFQSQKEDKAEELIEYARTLYSQQQSLLKKRFPLSKPLGKQSTRSLEFANGSRLVGIPEGADQIRSYHPWALFMDEAAFQPKAGEAYDHAVPVCQKIIVVSSAGPGWFADLVNDNL